MSDNIPGLGWTKTKGVYQHGKRALKVPMSLHRAARAKLLEKLESAGINAGILDNRVEVELPGGILNIEWGGDSDDDVIMTGPVTEVFEGTWS